MLMIWIWGEGGDLLCHCFILFLPRHIVHTSHTPLFIHHIIIITITISKASAEEEAAEDAVAEEATGVAEEDTAADVAAADTKIAAAGEATEATVAAEEDMEVVGTAEDMAGGMVAVSVNI